MTDVGPEAFISEVPAWRQLTVPVLAALSDGKLYHRKELFAFAADAAQLSPQARAETLSSGGLRYEQRMGWVLSNLSKASLIDRPNRGYYRINDDGRKWLSEHPQGMDDAAMHQFFAPFWPHTREYSAASLDEVNDNAAGEIDPLEQIEDGINRIHLEVGDSLLTRLRESHPDFFEQAVVDLLLKMGYGGAEQRGKRIGGSGDGGVDGVIDQDALGLDQIYVQAKRYKDGNNVGRETIQAFVGALHGAGAARGVFITTSGFTDKARSYASGISSRVVLIDARRLVGLMIKYRVGIQSKETYTVVEIDEDFFE